MDKIVFFIFFFFSVSVQAQEIKISEVNETFSKKVKVSGSYFHGLQYAGKHELDELYVHLPEASAGKLCIAIISIDGRYKAKLRHKILSPLSGRTKISFNSKYLDSLSSYKENELAINARLGDNCGQELTAPKLVVSWGEEFAPVDLIIFLRSDAHKDTAMLPNSERPLYTVKCQKITGSYNVSYDKKCILSAKEFQKYNTVEFVRKHFRKYKNEFISIKK